MPGPSRKLHREEEVGQNAGMVVDREAPEPCDRPSGGDGQREDVAVLKKIQTVRAEPQNRGERAADDTARRRKSVPDFEDLQCSQRAMQLLRMVEEQVHQMTADHSSNDGPWSKIAHRLCVQSLPRSLANQQPGRDRHACRREHTKRLQRNWPDVQRWDLEVWDHLNLLSGYEERGGAPCGDTPRSTTIHELAALCR